MRKLNSKQIWTIVLVILAIGFGYNAYTKKMERDFMRCLNAYDGPGGEQEVCGRKVFIEANPYD